MSEASGKGEEEQLKDKIAIGEHHGVKFYNISPLLLDPQVT